MTEKNFDIALNTMFVFDGLGCKCAVDINNETPDEPSRVTLKWCADEEMPLHFSYAPKSGLDLTGNAGGVIDGNILGRLLAIPKDDVDKHIEFFQKYGFLVPISSSEYTAIDADTLIEIVNRIKATVRLMNAVNSRNYRGVLVHAAYLLYATQIQMNFSGFAFMSCSHRFSELLHSPPLFPDLNNTQEMFNTGAYPVPDTMLGGWHPVDIKFYNAVRSNSDTDVKGSRDPMFKKLMSMYVGHQNEDEETRFLIDFFYHFQTEISVFKEVKFGRIFPYSRIDEDSFSEEIKDALLRVARIILTKELNHNIADIHPKYDGANLSASWQISSFIQALYFSIFYMKRGEIYKECENPNCKRNKFFLVKSTRSTRKYCCAKCSNAAASQRHRDRAKE